MPGFDTADADVVQPVRLHFTQADALAVPFRPDVPDQPCESANSRTLRTSGPLMRVAGGTSGMVVKGIGREGHGPSYPAPFAPCFGRGRNVRC